MKNNHYQVYLNSVVDFNGYLEGAIRYCPKNPYVNTFASTNKNIICDYEYLSWDSEIFGVSTGRINSIFWEKEPLPEEIEVFINALDNQLHRENMRFAFIRFNGKHRTFLSTFERLGWQVTDTLNIYTTNTMTLLQLKKVPVISNVIIKKPLSEDIKGFFQQEKDLFSHARMYRDPCIQRHTAGIFYRKLFNHLYNKATSITLGMYQDNRLIGFIIGDRDEQLYRLTGYKLAYLWEIGILKEARGKGYSKVLLKAFLEKNLQSGTLVEIGTQVDNFSANGLYNSLGLSLVSQASTLHKWFA